MLRLEKHNGKIIYVLESTEYSDYYGSNINKSNYQYLQKKYPHIEFVELTGPYNYNALAVTEITEELLEIAEEYDSYSILDEELYSELEIHDFEKTIEEWLIGDILKETELESYANNYQDKEVLEAVFYALSKTNTDFYTVMLGSYSVVDYEPEALEPYIIEYLEDKTE